MKRGLLRGLLSCIILFSAITIIKSYQWYKVGENGSTLESVEIIGDDLSRKEAQKHSKDFDNNKRYFYKYYVDIKYVRSTFPFVNNIIDTTEITLWHKKKIN